MVSHDVWKWWPLGLSDDKDLGFRPRFLSTESLGPCSSHVMGDHDQILHCMSPTPNNISPWNVKNITMSEHALQEQNMRGAWIKKGNMTHRWITQVVTEIFLRHLDLHYVIMIFTNLNAYDKTNMIHLLQAVLLFLNNMETIKWNQIIALFKEISCRYLNIACLQVCQIPRNYDHGLCFTMIYWSAIASMFWRLHHQTWDDKTITSLPMK